MRKARAVVSVLGVAGLVSAGVALTSCGGGGGAAHVVGPSREAVGKYLVITGGCNDCHTPGVMQGAQVPEERWLTGLPVGFRGPWGTSYPANLRLAVGQFTEESFVKAMKLRNTNPPMPWSALHGMTDENLGAIYTYIKSLGPAGERMPQDLPPGKEPSTPYINMEPVMPGVGALLGGAASAPATKP